MKPCHRREDCDLLTLRRAEERMYRLADDCARNGWTDTAHAAHACAELLDAPPCPLGRACLDDRIPFCAGLVGSDGH